MNPAAARAGSGKARAVPRGGPPPQSRHHCRGRTRSSRVPCCAGSETAEQALLEIRGGAKAKVGLSLDDVRLFVADVARARGAVNGLYARAQAFVDPVDEREEGCAAAAGDVIHFPG